MTFFFFFSGGGNQFIFYDRILTIKLIFKVQYQYDDVKVEKERMEMDTKKLQRDIEKLQYQVPTSSLAIACSQN